MPLSVSNMDYKSDNYIVFLTICCRQYMYMGLIFLSIQPICAFWLEHLIHLHLG